MTNAQKNTLLQVAQINAKPKLAREYFFSNALGHCVTLTTDHLTEEEGQHTTANTFKT